MCKLIYLMCYSVGPGGWSVINDPRHKKGGGVLGLGSQYNQQSYGRHSLLWMSGH